LQPDGKVLIGGDFLTFNGATRIRIARLNTNGSLDTGFDPGTTSANKGVRPMVVQPDGKILTSGDFTSFSGASRNHLTRLNSDGTLDTSFDVGSGANDYVGAIALQPDGRILIGGRFSTYNGSTAIRLARLGNVTQVSWSDGDNAPKTIAITIVDDNLVEGDEQLNLTLVSTTGGAVLGSPVSTTLTILDNDFPTVSALSGSGQSTTINNAFSQPLVAQVSGVSNATVTFTAPVSGASGTFDGGATTFSGTTDASGLITTTTFTANNLVGSYTVTATIAGFANQTPANFDLTNLAGSVASLTVITGSQQAAPINTAFNKTIILQAKDALGNPVGGQPIMFNVPANGASGTFAGGGGVFTTNTDSNGQVFVSGFTANSFVGQYSMTAIANGPATPTYISLTNQTSYTATRVYGQLGSFITNTVNNGGLSANSLNSPAGIAFDSGGGLYVADYANSRVLYFPAGSTTATRVYGQNGSFSSSTANNGGISASTLFSPTDTLVDSSGGLYVTDSGNNRVLYFPSGSTTATRVYGQPNFTSNTANNGGISANSLSSPDYLALDSSGGLYVSDYANSRVLYFPAGSTTATRVYGQNGSFSSNTANNGGISANSLSNPEGMALDSSGGVYISDSSNSRVLYYPAGSTTASRVYGQPNFASNTANNSGESATTFNYPVGLTLDSAGGLYVADFYNNRVLYFASDGDTVADRVYGQRGNFTTRANNSGGISAASLLRPLSVLTDSSNNLYIADLVNNRVLYYPNQAVGSLQFESASYSQLEGNSLVLKVTRTGGSTMGALVKVNATNLTTNPSDFSFTPSLLSWADGDSSPKYVTVTLNVDASQVPTRTFALSLTAFNGGINLGSAATTTFTILDGSCNALQVTSGADDGSCGTLRTALGVAGGGANKQVTINLAAGSVITLTSGLNLAAGVSITTTAGCATGPAITLKGSGNSSGNGLTLSSGNSVYGLWIKGFSSQQIVAPSGGGNTLRCVKSSKS
jgi:uncharacterized delta-60 repeat protein